ncbi:MAG: hypothetical protein JWN66_2139 [Sphingomonas bacterium]|uniref:hypothetical protein n=1 Tax=Sphingomonas bacterium TaxID=1895847 RepID=UPI00260851E8|nr:hypothetical protein [Sphingomonas bacterium]MDB5705023.1 hypothetical protein [Sphingomonas bacterium]
MTSPEESGAGGASVSRRRFNLVDIALVISFVSIQIVIEQFRNAGIAEWSFGAIVGIAAAAVIFRSKRARPWYWPSLALIVAVQVALIVSKGSGLPTDMGKGLMLLALLDAGATGLFLLWMGWLFDPHQMPRTRASTIVEVMIYGFAVIFIAIIGLVYWATQHAA